jgi:hypothetical protein
VTPEVRQKLALALRQAKKAKPMRKEDIEPGKLTNEGGPQVTTNKTPDEWPTDG